MALPLADHEPIFLTRRRTPYTRSSWYYHWNQLLAAVPPDEHTEALGPVLFTPHDTRHLYVSWLLRQMKRRYKDDTEKQTALRLALQQRMGWRSPLTIMCYDQSESDRERLELLDSFLQELEHSAEQTLSLPKPAEESAPSVSSAPQPVLSVVNTTNSLPHRDLSDLAFWEKES